MKFDELKLDGAILSAVASAGFEETTDIQAKAIPAVLERRDVMAQSQTGTGKTAAFLLPTFQLLLHDEDFQGATALVVAPTRELAVQIKEEADVLGEGLNIRAEVFHGGVGYAQQQKALAEGLDLIVGTPGRILDLTQSGHMRLDEVRIAIIDEADRLFDMGFYPDIRKMFRKLAPKERRLNMLFSATLSTKARNIAWEHMNDPVEIEVQPEHVTVEKVKQSLYHVATEEKMSVLLGLLQTQKPRNAIVFTNTKRAAEEVAKRLEINGYPSEFIIGDLPQRKRLSIIKRIKSGESEFLVATDVAARGLHINDLDMVVNYDLPEDPEAYVHRIGRTARAGESGQAVSLACQKYVFGLDSIESLIRQKIPVADLTDDLYAEDQSAGMRIYTGDAARGRDARGGGRGTARSGGRHGGRSSGRDSRGPSRSGGRGGERSDRGRRSAPTGADGERSSAGAGGGKRASEKRSSNGGDKASAGGHGERGRGGPHQKPRRGAPPATGAGTAPKSGDSLESRLEYYRRKYGEDFQPTDEMLANMQDDGRGGKRSGGKSGGASGRRSGGKQRASGETRAGGTRADGGPTHGGRAESARPESPHDSAGTPEARESSKKGILGRVRSLFGGKNE